MGADDYISKPFGTSELLARIRTALRHSAKNNGGAVNNDVFSTKGLTIDFDKRKITVDGKDVHLTRLNLKSFPYWQKAPDACLHTITSSRSFGGLMLLKNNQDSAA